MRPVARQQPSLRAIADEERAHVFVLVGWLLCSVAPYRAICQKSFRNLGLYRVTGHFYIRNLQ